MSEQMNEQIPDTDEVQQHEQEARNVEPVPVVVEGPVRTQPVGALVWASFDMRGIAQTAVQLLSADLRRSRVIILVSAGTHIRPTEAQCEAAVGFAKTWPANVPLELKHTGEIWVAADAATIDLVVFVEYWSD